MIAIAYTNKQNETERINNKLDKLGSIFNIILSIIYFPISGFSMLMFTASESTIGVANKLYISLITIFCYITISIPLICIICVALSVILRIKGKSIISFYIQFLPLVIFIINMSFLAIVEKWVK
jgi:Na+-driven multidrug efflux pump